MSEALKQPTVVILLPHELAAVVAKLREIEALARTAVDEENPSPELLKKVSLAGEDLWRLAFHAFHHAVTAPEPDSVFMVLGAPLHIHEGGKE